MVGALFDSCILIDFLNGIPVAADELRRYETRAISVVTWIEVMAGAPVAQRDATARFLAGFTLVALDATVAAETVLVRRDFRLKLPDAIVFASARVAGFLLVTRDRKNFPGDDPGVRFPYGAP
jgi:predicted nucleic acid-binding protein